MNMNMKHDLFFVFTRMVPMNICYFKIKVYKKINKINKLV